MTTDVVLVGGGISALIAALELCQRGRRVTIVEGSPREQLGGQCRDAFGGIFFVGSPEQRRVGVRDSPELAWADWQGYAGFTPGDPNTQHQQRWAQHYIERCLPEVREWLIAQGSSFFPMANWAERAHDGLGNQIPRFHLTWGCGPRLVDVVLAALLPYEGRQLQILSGHRVDELLTSGGVVTGVRGRVSTEPNYRADRWSAKGDPGPVTPFEISAESVCIAAGGWTGNLDAVRAQWPQHTWGEAPTELLCGVWPQSDGAMHEAAQQAGATLAGLDDMWVYAAGLTHLDPDYPGHGMAIIPPKSAMWLQADGRRFDPVLLAGYDTRAAVAQIAAQEHPWSWLVLSRAILDRELAIQGARYNPGFRQRSYPLVAREIARGSHALAQRLIDESPDVVHAEDLPTLGAKMSALTPSSPVDITGMIADINAYDAQIERGSKFFTDPQLVSLGSVRGFLSDRLRTANFRPIVDAKSPQLVALRTRMVARKSLGGIVTDASCRAIDSTGAPVPGLYAIGESAGFGGGGMNGQRTLEGTLLGGCVLTARDFARQLP